MIGLELNRKYWRILHEEKKNAYRGEIYDALNTINLKLKITVRTEQPINSETFRCDEEPFVKPCEGITISRTLGKVLEMVIDQNGAV